MSLAISRRDARRAALTGLIDYAGLYPPTSLGMEEAVAEFRAARRGADAWMIDRFICPADRLIDLGRVLVTTLERGEAPWSIVVTATPEDRRMVADFASEMGRAASIAAVELRPLPVTTIEAVAEALTAFDRLVFFEVPWQGPFEGDLDVLARARQMSGRILGAKIRCGGVTADAFPSPEVVAAFLVACARLALPVKATAGLHHPFRHFDPGTGFTHHGFINLLAAAGLAQRGAEADTVAAVLADDDPSSFALEAGGLRWCDERLGPDDLTATRGDLLVGYGSCSFTEPVEDLTTLGVLPVGS